jgi:chromosome partitioning protein
MTTTIAFSAQKGGVSKSTSSITIASYLARAGKQVLIIDLDGQCNTTEVLLDDYKELKPEETVAAMLSVNVKDIVQSVLYPTSRIKNLDIIPSHSRLSEAETILNGLDLRERRLQLLLKPIKAQYDYIIIDCPPNINMLPINAWVASDFIVITAKPSAFDLHGLSSMLSKVGQTRDFYNPNLRVLGFLVTMFDHRNGISHEIYDLLKTKFPNELFQTKIPINTAMEKAIANNQDIFEYEPYSNAALAYKSLIEKELIPRIENKEVNTLLQTIL